MRRRISIALLVFGLCCVFSPALAAAATPLRITVPGATHLENATRGWLGHPAPDAEAAREILALPGDILEIRVPWQARGFTAWRFFHRVDGTETGPLRLETEEWRACLGEETVELLLAEPEARDWLSHAKPEEIARLRFLTLLPLAPAEEEALRHADGSRLVVQVEAAHLAALLPLLLHLQPAGLRLSYRLGGEEPFRDPELLARIGSLEYLEMLDGPLLRVLSPLERLPKLKALVLRRCERLRDLSAVAQMPHLLRLDLDGSAEAADLSPLENHPSLRALGLPPKTTNAMLVRLAAWTPKLESLRGGEVSSISNLAALADLPALRHLHLGGCDGVRDLSPLARLAELESLSLGKAEGVESLTPLANLEHLAVVRIDGAAALEDTAPLASLPALVELRLSRCGRLRLSLPGRNPPFASLLEADCYGSVAEPPLLEALAFGPSLRLLHAPAQLTGADLKRFAAGLGSLETLSVTLSPELESLSPLAGLTHLADLMLFDLPKVTESGPLGSLPALRSLAIHRCPGVRDLSFLSALPALHAFWGSGLGAIESLPPPETDAQWRVFRLEGARDLRDLSGLSGCGELRELGLHDSMLLADLAPLSNLRSLRALSLSGAELLEGIAPLASLSELRTLRLEAPSLGDLSPLGECPKLRALDLRGCRRLDSLAVLRRLPSLERFTPPSMVNDAQLAGIASAFPGLRALVLRHCADLTALDPVGALSRLERLDLQACPRLESLRPLRRLPRLRELWIRDCAGIGEAEAEELKRSLPQCQVYFR